MLVPLRFIRESLRPLGCLKSLQRPGLMQSGLRAVCIHRFVYFYIYIEREREGDAHIYIYIYIYMMVYHALKHQHLELALSAHAPGGDPLLLFELIIHLAEFHLKELKFHCVAVSHRKDVGFPEDARVVSECVQNGVAMDSLSQAIAPSLAFSLAPQCGRVWFCRQELHEQCLPQ